MASDDFDIVIEAMLEAPYKKEEDEQQRKEVKKDGPSNPSSSTGNSGSGSSTSAEASKKKSRSHSKSRDRKRSRSQDRSRDRDRHRRRSSRSRSRDRQHRHHSQSWDHQHSSESRSRAPRRENRVHYRSPPLATGHRYGHSKSPHFREKSPVRESIDNLSPEERDARTVFCMQLAARIRPRDLEDFFSAIGKVRDVRIISDRNSRRSKGIAYVEFCEIQSVPLAIALTGQRLLGVPIIVQASQAEKNRLAAMANNLQKGSGGPMRLCVGSLHCNITEDMLRGIFEPFGKIDNIVLMKDSDTGRSKGYGFITFSDSECARRALEQLNGFELAGRPMRVGHVTERLDGGTDITFPDGDQELNLGSAGGRLQLMAKLAEGSGIQLPTTAAAAAAAAQAAALQLNGAIHLGALNPAALTGRRGLGKGIDGLGLGRRNALCSLTHFASSLCSSSESSPEPCLSGNCLPVLPAFQPFYPPDHVSRGTSFILDSGYFLSFYFHLPLLFVPSKSVAQYIASLCLWVLPLHIYHSTAPSIHFVDQAILKPWTLTLGELGSPLDTKKSSCPWTHWEWTLLSNH
ncbi:probable RNA-binding protein 23 isoform X3 [Myotis lucifugus]|nr:probable RNA-binding protein 23 isoform X3 [Myotis lucifugus]XP_023619436.1 probable RNA-binding protein 23 isoform X3 [Myotis lucifugus]XP_023619437.1 probable RNA-binding protein 23 isoform X3 [Myotis lucifugus]